jgi:hypothetical protein
VINLSFERASREGELVVDWFMRRPIADDGTTHGLQTYLQRGDRLDRLSERRPETLYFWK